MHKSFTYVHINYALKTLLSYFLQIQAVPYAKIIHNMKYCLLSQFSVFLIGEY
jgi:hypothetical protein